MQNTPLENLVVNAICSYCYPSHTEELFSLAPDLVHKDGNWVGGYTAEKYNRFKEISNNFEKDRKTLCMTVESDYGVYICKKHLKEIYDRLS